MIEPRWIDFIFVSILVSLRNFKFLSCQFQLYCRLVLEIVWSNLWIYKNGRRHFLNFNIDNFPKKLGVGFLGSKRIQQSTNMFYSSFIPPNVLDIARVKILGTKSIVTLQGKQISHYLLNYTLELYPWTLKSILKKKKSIGKNSH